MPKSLQSEPEDQSFADETPVALISRQVIRTLGSPKDLLKVRVHPVGGDHYRVNVVTGKELTSSRIANSFFLTVDTKGKIINSIPELTKKY